MNASKYVSAAATITISLSMALVSIATNAATRQTVPKSSLKIEQSAADTLTMTCAQARTMVKGHNGILLRTGANQFDRYHAREGECFRTEAVGVPAFVKSKDNPLCYIGLTCETGAGAGGEGD